MRSSEQIYDKEIYPLMTKIMAVCQANNMPMFAHFPVLDKDGERLAVTSSLGFGDPLIEHLVEVTMPERVKYAGVVIIANEDGSFSAEITESEGYTTEELRLIKAVAIKKATEDGHQH